MVQSERPRVPRRLPALVAFPVYAHLLSVLDPTFAFHLLT